MEGLVPQAVPGGYRLGRQVRASARAEIYEAAHPRVPGRYAIKILSASLARDPKATRAFKSDAELTASLRHPNIVQIIDINQLPDGRPFLVMEYLDGVDLEARLAGDATLPLVEALTIVKSVAAGLQAAHMRGVVHRDVRPENLFLVPLEGHEIGFVKILNFGMSALAGSAGTGGGNVHFVGTPHTMAPEQALGKLDEVDARTDQFALAAITFRVLSGIHAFRGDDPLGVLYQIVHARPRSLSMRSLCPPEVELVLHKALSKSKADRYDSVLAFARELELAAIGAPVSVSTAPTPMVGVPRIATPSAGAPSPFAPTTEVLVDGAPYAPQPRASDGRPSQVPVLGYGEARAFGRGSEQRAAAPSNGHRDAVDAFQELAPADAPLPRGAGFDDLGFVPQVDGGIDDFSDLDEGPLRVPKRRAGPIVFLLIVLVGGTYTGLHFAGDRVPSEWRRSELWLKLRLPHALTPGPDDATVAVAPPAGVQPTGAATVVPVPATETAAVAPVESDAAIAVTAPVAPAAEPPAAPAEAPPPEPAAAPAAVAPEPEAAPPAEARPARRRSSRRDRGPAPIRNYVWSEKEGRLVPVEGPLLIPMPGASP